MAYRVGTIKYRRVAAGWEVGLRAQTFQPVERLDFGNDDGTQESNRMAGRCTVHGSVIRSEQTTDRRSDSGQHSSADPDRWQLPAGAPLGDQGRPGALHLQRAEWRVGGTAGQHGGLGGDGEVCSWPYRGGTRRV